MVIALLYRNYPRDGEELNGKTPEWINLYIQYRVVISKDRRV